MWACRFRASMLIRMIRHKPAKAHYSSFIDVVSGLVLLRLHVDDQSKNGENQMYSDSTPSFLLFRLHGSAEANGMCACRFRASMLALAHQYA